MRLAAIRLLACLAVLATVFGVVVWRVQATGHTNDLLVRAILARQSQAAILAIDRGADPNFQFDDSVPANDNGGIATAIRKIWKMVTGRRSNRGRPVLIMATERDMDSVVEHLLRAGSRVDACGPDGFSALLTVAYTGNAPIMRLLLQNHANPNGRFVGGFTPIVACGMHGQVECAKLLIEAGADVNAVNDKGESALTLAALWGEAEVARVLVSHGADRAHKNAQGLTAFDIAKQNANDDLARMLSPNASSTTAKQQ